MPNTYTHRYFINTRINVLLNLNLNILIPLLQRLIIHGPHSNIFKLEKYSLIPQICLSILQFLLFLFNIIKEIIIINFIISEHSKGT